MNYGDLDAESNKYLKYLIQLIWKDTSQFGIEMAEISPTKVVFVASFTPKRNIETLYWF